MIIFLPPSRGGRRRGGRRRHDDCCCDDDIIDAMRFKPSQWTVVVVMVVERDTKSTLEMVYYSYSFFLGVAGPSLQDISHFFKYHHGTTIRTPPPPPPPFFSLFRVLKKQRKKTEKKTKKKGGKVGREHQTKKQNRWGLFLRLRWKRRRI